MKIFFSAVAAVICASAFAANTWHVDDDWYGKGGDGTEAAPYGTIQEAIDATATQNGDTILVEPGVYSNGVNTSGTYPVRVFVNKALTIRSTKGRERTHIVGQLSEAAGGAAGATSVGCVIVYTGSGQVLFDGFTLRDGCVPDTSTTGQSGGGFDNRYSGTTAKVHLYRCTVRDCAAYGGIVRNVQAHRCLVLNNTTVTDSGACQGVTLDNSIVCGTRYGTGGQSNTYINCVVAGCSGKAGYGCSAYNTIYAMNGADFDSRDGASQVSNNVFNSSISTITLESAAKKFPCADEHSLFAVTATNLFVAPRLLDFRPLASSVANGRGRTTWLSKVSLPEGYELLDYVGNAIDLGSEVCNPGAVQPTVEPQGGCCLFDSVACTSVEVDGVPGSRTSVNYAYAEHWPTQWCVTAATPATSPLSCIGNTMLGSNLYRFAGKDGRIWFMPPPAGTTATISASVAKDFRYVNPDAGNDAWDGKSAVHVGDTTTGPWRTLIHAGTNKTVSTSRTMVFCAAGRYAEGQGSKSRMQVNADRLLHFVGAGAGESFVVGAPAPEGSADAYGLGDGALRCVYNGVNGTGFTGFTFCEGYTEKANNENSGLASAWSSVGFTECVISNIVSAQCFCYGGKVVFERCLFTDNNIRGAGFFYGDGVAGGLIGCVFRNNVNNATSYPMIPHNFKVCNTTFLRGGVTGDINVTAYSNCYVYNSIFSDFNSASYGLKAAGVLRGCVLDNCKGAKTGFSDYVEGDALYWNEAAGDYTLRIPSPARTVGVAEPSTQFAAVAGTDFEGNPVCLTGQGICAGAFIAPVCEDALDVHDPNGLLTVSGDPADGGYRLAAGESLTVAANPMATRPVVGVTVNGETNLFDEATGTVTFTHDDAGIVAEPVLGDIWYVNAGTSAGWAKGSDENCGFGRWAPKLTLVAGVKNAVSNDMVIAAPGRYDQGSKVFGSLPCRVVVPNYVTLRAEGRPEETFIIGTNATQNVDEWGCGDDAMRCVHLNIGSRLVGFTLTGGRSKANNTSSSGSTDCAAVGYAWNQSDATRPLVQDCIISNNVGSLVVVGWVDLLRCRVLDNIAYDSCVIRKANMRDVLVARNKTKSSSGLVIEMDGRLFENVTVADDNQTLSGARMNGVWSTAASTICRNSVFLSSEYFGSSVQVTNCLFANTGISQKSMIVDASRVHLDADYRPIVAADNAVLDSGCNAVRDDAADLASATDASGRVRVSNGTVDIGALEGDWNPVYSKRLGRGVTVAEASPSCVTNAEGGVSLGTDGTLALDWTLGGTDGEILVDVTGTGVLTVIRNGTVAATFTSATEPMTYAFRPEDGSVQKFVFAYVSGENDYGTAAILRCKRQIGTVLIVR